MFRHHLHHLETLWKCVRSVQFNEIFLQYFCKYLISICFQKYYRKLKL